MRQRRNLSLCTLWLLVGLATYAQSPAPANVSDSPRERVFVHINRTDFFTGEQLWWKAYLLDDRTRGLSQLSKIGYLEILDVENRPVVQGKIKWTNGVSDGSLFLPATLSSGVYRLCGYTRWMRNSAPHLFFYQTITIINPFKKLDAPGTMSAGLDVQLLPEGGHLVRGLTSTIGVRGVNSEGMGSDYEIVVVNNSGDTTARASSIRFGLSSFVFTPQEGHEYQAFARTPKGKWISLAFPVIESSGISINAQRTDNSLRVNIAAAGVDLRNTSISLIHRQSIRFHHQITASANASQVFIPFDSLGEGVNSILLSHPGGVTIERLFFKYPKSNPRHSFTSEKKNVGLREKVNFKTPNISSAFDGTLSLSIYRVDSLSFEKKTTLETYLLLTSNLMSEVEDPNFYFSDDAARNPDQIDLVMLTHGWSTYQWKPMNVIKYVPELGGHLVDAQVLPTPDFPKHKSGVQATLAVPGRTIRFYPASSDTTGYVHFELIDFEGRGKMVISPYQKNDSLISFRVMPPFARDFSPASKRVLHLTPSIAPVLIERSIAMQTENVYKNNESIPTRPHATFYGEPDETYLLDDYTRFPVMEEVLREYVAGIRVRKRGNSFVFQMPNKAKGGLLAGPPLVLLDGVPVHDLNQLMAVDPLKIERIETINRLYYLNGFVFPGIASFSTYKGDMAGLELKRPAMVEDYDGVLPTKTFYSPKYETVDDRAKRIPDRRTQLNWDPNFSPRQDQITFYTSDMPGTYVIEAWGIDMKGQYIQIDGSIIIK